MNTLGWQIGAFLIGLSSLIIAIYFSKLLNSLNKVVENFQRIITYNERYINEIIENTSNITKEIDSIFSVLNKFTDLFKVFKFIRK